MSSSTGSQISQLRPNRPIAGTVRPTPIAGRTIAGQSVMQGRPVIPQVLPSPMPPMLRQGAQAAPMQFNKGIRNLPSVQVSH